MIWSKKPSHGTVPLTGGRDRGEGEVEVLQIIIFFLDLCLHQLMEAGRSREC